jgi:hypothetical protein
MDEQPKSRQVTIAAIPTDKMQTVTVETLIRLQASVNALAETFCTLVTAMARRRGDTELEDDEYYQYYLEAIEEQIPHVSFVLNEQYPLQPAESQTSEKSASPSNLSD